MDLQRVNKSTDNLNSFYKTETQYGGKIYEHLSL